MIIHRLKRYIRHRKPVNRQKHKRISCYEEFAYNAISMYEHHLIRSHILRSTKR
jgi:hypothetical protein